MAAEGEPDQAAMLRGILENMAANELARGSGSADNVAQLLAAAIAQVGRSIVTTQVAQSDESETLQDNDNNFNSATGGGTTENIEVNPQDSGAEYSTSDQDAVAVMDREAPPSIQRPKPICIKFPIDLRMKIIAMRKSGSKCKDIAKELKVSVSGVKKVWERFLATGMVHDRKPSSYAGRPRKYTYSQESPITPNFETQYLGEGEIEVFQTSSGKMEYVTTTTEDTPSTPHTSTPITTSTPLCVNENEIDTVIITADNEVFSDGPLGATVEIVETPTPTTPTPRGAQRGKKKTPVYRGQLLMRLVEDCPLAAMKEMTDSAQNTHLQNLNSSVNKPLYMEYVLGHPFGKVPSPKPFEANTEEAKIILSDPSVPIGKELLAALGYSTKVFFNACCKPSPLFDVQKVLTSLPLSLGPGHMSETMLSVLQLLLGLCEHPVEVLGRLPEVSGPAITVYTSEGDVTKSRSIPTPVKLSEYWNQLYCYAALLECCENFLSASPPSAPCLLCHPFELFAQKLEIKDVSTSSTPVTPLPPSQPHSSDNQLLLESPSPTQTPPTFPLNPAPLGTKKTPQPEHDNHHPPIVPSDSGESLSETIPPIISVRTDVPTTVVEDSTLSENVDDTETVLPHKPPRRSARITKTLDSSTSPQKPSSPRKRKTRDSSSDGSPEMSSSSLPPAKRTRRALAADAVARAAGKDSGKHPAQWGVDEVVAFVDKIPHCNCTEVFKEHEVDGESLVSLDPEIMVKLMELKTGPALRVHRHITALKQQFDIL